LDKSEGLLIFDVYGNFWKKITVNNVNWFGTIGDEIYYLSKEKKLILNHLYNDQIRQIEVPENEGVIQVLLLEDRMVVFKEQEISYFLIKQE
jgi:hypothetical protein